MSGTSFDCEFSVFGHSQTGLVGFSVGPVQMGDIAELIEYMKTDAFGEQLLAAVAKSLL